MAGATRDRAAAIPLDHESLAEDVVRGALGRALSEWWEASGLREEMVRDIASELFTQVAILQDEITRARQALAEADTALLDVLGSMGIPSRPGHVSHLRDRRRR